jgi:FAD-dependent urate hydroxylase
VSHPCDYADLGGFDGQTVIVIGAGQSALESAALLSERGANVEIVARAGAIRWLGTGDGSGATARPRIAIPLPPTDVGGRVTGWLAATPDVFRRAPERVRSWAAPRCVLPAGAGSLRPRVDGVTFSLGRRVVRAAAEEGQMRLVLDDHSERLADHVLLATGYNVDALRYPFLASDLASEISVRDGYPLLRSGLESSVPGLHFLGAPAALSFGPINRFVVGTWYAAPALTRRILGKVQRPIGFSF